MPSVKLVRASDFLPDLLDSIEKAQSRIWIQSMLYENGVKTRLVTEKLVSKAKNGLDVRFVIDWVYSKYVNGKLDLLPVADWKWQQTKNQKQVENRRELLRMQEAGVKLVVKNKPKFWHHVLPFVGRNHMKMYVVDDRVWVGGMNFTDGSFENIDFMVKFSDSEMSRIIAGEFDPGIEKGNYRVKINDDYELLVDGGKVGESIILEAAIKAASQANEKILFVSQFLPNRSISQALIRMARKGRQIKIVTSDEDDSLFKKQPHKMMYWWARKALEREKNIRIIHIKDKVHAKYMQVDDKIAIFGSHNLIETSVWLGTGEVGVLTTDKALISEVNGHFDIIACGK